jgi:hypothetical protein
VTPDLLEPYFAKWKAELNRQEELGTEGSAVAHINNPRIPLKFIAQIGIQVWPPVDIELPQQLQAGLELSEELEES